MNIQFSSTNSFLYKYLHVVRCLHLEKYVLISFVVALQFQSVDNLYKFVTKNYFANFKVKVNAKYIVYISIQIKFLPKHLIGRKAILKYPIRQKHLTTLESAVHMWSHPPLFTAHGPSVGSITVKVIM